MNTKKQKQRRLDSFEDCMDEAIDKELDNFWKGSGSNVSWDEYKQFIDFHTLRLENPHLEMPPEIREIERKLFTPRFQIDRVIKRAMKLWNSSTED
jgi:hypothetical protein